MTDKHINYDYYNTLTIKASLAKFEFHGKPNAPNLIFHDGSQTKKYVSTNIYLIKSDDPNFDGELVIEHKLITNYGEKMFIHFPLKTDTLIAKNEIDQLLSIEPGDSLEVNLNKVITEQSECIYRKANVAIFTKPIIIKTTIMERNLINSNIIEGGCSTSDVASLRALEADMAEMREHIKKTSDAHGGIGSGSGSGATLTADQLRALLDENMLQCDQLDTGENKKVIRTIFNMDPTANIQKMDLTNPLALMLGGLISLLGTYIVVTAGYKEMLYKLYNGFFSQNVHNTLFYMKIIEGIIPFILFVTFVSIYSKKHDPNTASIIMISWISYSMIIGGFKSGIIRSVMASKTVEVETAIKKEHYIITNMLWAYPFWPIYTAYNLVMYRPS